MADEWRRWFRVMFWIYLIATSQAFIGGLFALGAPDCLPVTFCCNVGFGCSLVAKAGIFWWGVYMRFREQGRVAAGKMVEDC